jgi:hypothetical protein
VYGRCLQQLLLYESILRLHQRQLLEPLPKVHLDIVDGQFSEFGALEYFSQVLQRALINFMSLLRAERRPGEVLQMKVRPFTKGEILSAAQRGQRVVVSCCNGLR